MRAQVPRTQSNLRCLLLEKTLTWKGSALSESNHLVPETRSPAVPRVRPECRTKGRAGDSGGSETTVHVLRLSACHYTFTHIRGLHKSECYCGRRLPVTMADQRAIMMRTLFWREGRWWRRPCRCGGRAYRKSLFSLQFCWDSKLH